MKNKERGITLIALAVTIVVLLILATIGISTLTGNDGTIKQTKFAKFGAQIREYQKAIDSYVLEQDMNKDGREETIIFTENKEEIKKIIPIISDKDLEKYVIQNNELRYRTDEFSEEEKGWLAELGVAAMGIFYLITFMNGDKVFKTVYADKITFPLTNPTSSRGTFTGWFYDQEGTSQATTEDSITSSITLYAKYEAVQTEFVATYMANGSVYQTIKGNTLTFPTKNPTKVYANFTGWYYDETETNEVTQGDTITQNTTLYAGWYDIGPWTENSGGSGDEYHDGYGNYVSSYDGDTTIPPVDDNWYACGSPGEEGDRIWYFEFPGEYYYDYDYVLIIHPMPIEKAISYKLLACDGYLAEYNPFLDENGNLILVRECPGTYSVGGSFAIEVTYEDGTKEIFNYYLLNTYVYCLAKGTKITLADHTTKNIEDIQYEDNLLVWDFDNGIFATAKPLWIKKVQTAEEYNYVKFDDGTELKTVADHRIFNMESQKFTYTMNEEDTPIGTTVFKEDGTTTKLVERKVVKEEVEYYNIITDYHMNLFANGLLTSLRLNNLYKIKDMKFVKDDRKLATKEEFKNIPEEYFYGLRLAEQPKEINSGNDVKHTKTLEEYVQRLLPMAEEKNNKKSNS